MGNRTNQNLYTFRKGVNNLKSLLIYVKKPWAICLSAMTALVAFYSFVGAHVAEATLRSRVTSGSGDELVNTIDKAGVSLLDIGQQLSIVAAVLLVLWMAYSILFKKTAEGLADVKGRLLGLVVALFCAWKPEIIIGSLLKFFGVDI